MRSSFVSLVLAVATLLVGCQRAETVQHGFRGLNTAQLYKPADLAALAELNQIPAAEEPAEVDSPAAIEVFENVQVLKDVSATEFSRLMQALSTWVAPVEGCDYCHNAENLASDEKYPKVVARRMLEMTRQINTEWKAHVGETGVTCWTCHRGQAVPSGDWFSAPDLHGTTALLGNQAGQNRPNANGASLPFDPLSTYLITDNNIRVQGTEALAGGNLHSIKQAESTYSLMMYITTSLGVNCTYCHSSRAFAPWEQSTPQRATAWHGIRMVREINTDYVIPLKPLFPAHRLSPEGDTPKVGCLTCHKGTYKPLNGVSPLKDYAILAGVMAAASAPEATEAPAEPAQSSQAPVIETGKAPLSAALKVAAPRTP